MRRLPQTAIGWNLQMYQYVLGHQCLGRTMKCCCHSGRWFSGKSDVWRMCQDLAECMDGRVWPATDKDLVRASWFSDFACTAASSQRGPYLVYRH